MFMDAFALGVQEGEIKLLEYLISINDNAEGHNGEPFGIGYITHRTLKNMLKARGVSPNSYVGIKRGEK